MKKIILLLLIFLNLCVILYADEIGIASYYTIKSSSNMTANGEKYDEDALTCASNDYPFNTFLKVTNIENNKSVICRVNDRGGLKNMEELLI